MKKNTSVVKNRRRWFKERSLLIESYRKRLAEYGIALEIQENENLIYKGIETMSFFTVPEVAKKLRISKESVYRYLKGGFLPGIKFSNQGWRIKASELKNFLEKHHNQKMKRAEVSYWSTKRLKVVLEPRGTSHAEGEKPEHSVLGSEKA